MERLILFIVIAALYPVHAIAQVKLGSNIFTLQERAELKDGGGLKPYVSPDEPSIPQLKFLEQDLPSGIGDSVDRLVYGIKINVPAAYDSYGYEMRRYMAHIYAPGVFDNREKMVKSLNNVRRAKIILRYWKADIEEKVAKIEEEMKKGDVRPDIKTKYKNNMIYVKSFMAECKSWINKNESLLIFLIENDLMYEYVEPDFKFQSQMARDKFADAYMAAQAARRNMNKYEPYNKMVY